MFCWNAGHSCCLFTITYVPTEELIVQMITVRSFSFNNYKNYNNDKYIYIWQNNVCRVSY